MPLYINAEQAARYFASLRKKLPHDARDFMTRRQLAFQERRTGVEIRLFTACVLGTSDAESETVRAVSGRKLPQDCSCCRRNQCLKDNYKEA